ncbi:MAG: hypothetical protein JRH20_24265 [Deltaproteobacteria bacterium]|nr:hypothetical protein [Deltaproteobacteria bacterium]
MRKAFKRDPSDDHVAVLLPRRNIETWVVFLVGQLASSPSGKGAQTCQQTVNEEDDFKKHACLGTERFKVVHDAAKRLASKFSEGPPKHAPASLAAGWAELRDQMPDGR